LDELLSWRESALRNALELPRQALLERAAAERSALRSDLEALGQESLFAATPAHPWQPAARVTVFAYLEAWASHDLEHEFAIREAIASPPELSALAHIQRLR
jgi:hypothetical protein